MTKEKIFYQALKDIFTGAAIEGESGFVNLLKIKSAYYKLILAKFQEDVKTEALIQGDFKEEFFDKLHSFFEKYFSESGSVYFIKTANWQRVYEQVYTDNRDVVLFWKTHMLYYVKSDILFQNMEVAVVDERSGEEHRFLFDVGGLAAKQNNEKKELVFTCTGTKEGKAAFEVSYSDNGKKTKMDDIVKKTKIREELIEKAFKAFKKQSEVDFFINKDAEKFLTEQLDMFLHQILLAEENIFEQKRLDQLKVMKAFALKIIRFIAQFEGELVKIWNKPKFALNSNYVITLDKLSNGTLKKIAAHKNLPQQIKEWQELEMVDKGFKFTTTSDKLLPIDTKHFKDLELDILGEFEDLDDALDGRLIHSENYQALNTLQSRYKGKVQCIYIDPPFNLGQNADFSYKVNYKDANWATLLENRLRLAHKLLANTGSIFVRCDYHGNYIVRCLLDDIFGKDNFRNEIILAKTKEFFKTMTHIKKFSEETESLFFYSKSENILFDHIRKKKEKPTQNPPFFPVEDSDYSDSRIIEGKEYFSPKGRKWGPKQDNIEALIKEGSLKLIDKKWVLISTTEVVKNNWTEFQGYSRSTGFSTENAEEILFRCIESSSQAGDLVLDFFAGSATTQAVAQKLGRKWLGVEMGEQFGTIDLPRLKKTINGKQSGISSTLDNKYKGGGFFKYCDLEQYEDTLRKMRYKETTPPMIFDNQKAFEQYIFYADNKFADVLQVKGNGTKIDFNNLYANIDFAETISSLKGLPIKKITKDGVLLAGEKGEIKTDYKKMKEAEQREFIQLLKPLLWWGD